MSADRQALLREAIDGNETALACLLQEHDAALRRCVVGKIPQRWRAILSEDDILQQTYTDVFLNIREFEPAGQGAFLKWVTRIAENNLRTSLRALGAEKRGGRWRRVGPARGTDPVVFLTRLLADTAAETPSANLRRTEALQLLESAIRRLPEHYQQVVRLCDLEAHRVEDVAGLLGRSVGAIYLLRNRAHRRLRRLLLEG
jgi:RNA polymerase sigma factor (sigma-70 family)